MDAGGEINNGKGSVTLGSLSIAERFQRKAVELARQGVLGGLRTRKAGLQVAYGHLAALLDNPSISILVYGERGSGKRRLVDEYVVLHNFYRKLEGLSLGKLKIFRGDFVKEGFTNQLLTPQAHTADVIYIEAMELLDSACQKELLEHLKLRESFATQGIILPRLMMGTEKALSMMVLKKEFSRELFQAITGFAVFLPSLNERAEDLPQLIKDLAHEISNKEQSPPAWLVDHVSRQLWAENIDELKRMLRNGLQKKALLKDWTQDDLPQQVIKGKKGAFVKESPQDLTQVVAERLRLRQCLLQAGGDRKRAAGMAGMSSVEFLKKLLQLGLR